jgi:3-carboxy-cis,cis-muconate cycloisomerase
MESELAIIGLGPRGLSVAERLCANAGALLPGGRELVIHLVDPHVLDGGRVWRSTQDRLLLMNTVASQVTMFVDETVDCDGPVTGGPSLYEWARSMARPGGPDVPDAVRAEAATLGPDDYPSRSFYGTYLRWTLRRIMQTAPSSVAFKLHKATAVDVRDMADGRQEIVLDNGVPIRGLQAVVLALGHLPHELGASETALSQFADRHGLCYISPDNPADVSLSGIPPREPVILRGLGLNMFDYMALFTVGRGGRFVRKSGGRLTYVPSGQEPRLVAGSRRGVPYQARAKNQKGPFGRHKPLYITPEVIKQMRALAEDGAPADFRRDIWPLIDQEVRTVYYATLLRERGRACEAEEFIAAFATAERGPAPLSGDPLAIEDSHAQAAVLSKFDLDPGRCWDWRRIAAPFSDGDLTSTGRFRRWLRSYVDADVREAGLGNVAGPLKAATDVLRDLRNEIRLLVDHGGLSGDSYRDDLQLWYMPLNAYLSIGPPAERIEQFGALIDSGVLEVLGPDLRIATADGRFAAYSASCPDVTVRASTLIEARMPETDLLRTTAPLLRALLARGECGPYRIPIRGGGHYTTGGVAVTRRPCHLLDAEAHPHPRRFGFGVPTESVHWVTAAGIRPGVNSVILGDADAMARSCLRICAGAPAHVRSPRRRPYRTHGYGETRMTTADHGILAPAWAATGVAGLVDDHALVTAMLDTEVALAEAQAELGVVPAAAAAAIRAAAARGNIDPAALAAGVRETANPVVAFVGQLTAEVRAVDPAAAEYVHRGSTSQDILDTALMLLCAAVLDRMEHDLLACAESLAGHADHHRRTLMAGRTLTQHAVPITFGLKAATWLQLVLDAVERVRRTRATLPVSLGGAAGTLAAYHEYALDAGDPAAKTLLLPALVARRLGLAEPAIPWHGIRTPIADVAATLLITTGALGKLATDVLVLTRTEMGEVTEAHAPGRGASSAMPQKHNPVYSTLVATAGRQLPPIALVLFQSMVVEDERSAGGWHAEWQPLRECLRITAGACANASQLAGSLRISADAMAANLRLTRGAIVSERVNAALAPLLGKGQAKRILAEVTADAERDGADLADVLAVALDKAGVASPDLPGLLDPAGYTGISGPLVDRVLARFDNVLKERA